MAAQRLGRRHYNFCSCVVQRAEGRPRDKQRFRVFRVTGELSRGRCLIGRTQLRRRNDDSVAAQSINFSREKALDIKRTWGTDSLNAEREGSVKQANFPACTKAQTALEQNRNSYVSPALIPLVENFLTRPGAPALGR